MLISIVFIVSSKTESLISFSPCLIKDFKITDSDVSILSTSFWIYAFLFFLNGRIYSIIFVVVCIRYSLQIFSRTETRSLGIGVWSWRPSYGIALFVSWPLLEFQWSCQFFPFHVSENFILFIFSKIPLSDGIRRQKSL